MIISESPSLFGSDIGIHPHQSKREFYRNIQRDRNKFIKNIHNSQSFAFLVLFPFLLRDNLFHLKRVELDMMISLSIFNNFT